MSFLMSAVSTTAAPPASSLVRFGQALKSYIPASAGVALIAIGASQGNTTLVIVGSSQFFLWSACIRPALFFVQPVFQEYAAYLRQRRQLEEVRPSVAAPECDVGASKDDQGRDYALVPARKALEPAAVRSIVSRSVQKARSRQGSALDSVQGPRDSFASSHAGVARAATLMRAMTPVSGTFRYSYGGASNPQNNVDDAASVATEPVGSSEHSWCNGHDAGSKTAMPLRAATPATRLIVESFRLSGYVAAPVDRDDVESVRTEPVGSFASIDGEPCADNDDDSGSLFNDAASTATMRRN